MRYKVKRKQQNSRMCLVCGLKNPYGLQGAFYELENNELVCLFTPREEHQSYPGRLHGGIAAALLDETIGRALNIRYEHIVWGVTAEFSIRYKKPLPLNEELKVVGRITKETSRTFEGTGEIILPNGDVGAEGTGVYFKLPLDKIADFNAEEQEWKVMHSDLDPETMEI